jgi:tRNA G18 (ribose-2'-O)-methylase SpoU
MEPDQMSVSTPAATNEMKGYIIISNVAKIVNTGTIIRSANAFNMNTVLVVGGTKKLSTFGS